MRQIIGTRIIRAAALAAVLGSAAVPALAQGMFAPVIYINNAAVTEYEIDQRVRFLQLLRAPQSDRESVLRELINDRLKMQAAEQIGIRATDEGLQNGLAEFAGRANLGVDEFTQALAQDGIAPETFRDFVHAGLVWREVVRQRIIPGVGMSEREVEQALTRELQTPIVSAVLLSEIVIPAPPGSEGEALSRAEDIAAGATSTAAFAAAARRWSATPTAERGGALDWMPLDNMPPALQQIVLSLQPGQVTAPLQVPGAVVLFHLRDTRGHLRPGATDQTVEYLTMALPSAAEGARILAVARNCADVHVEANRFAPDPVSRQTAPLGAVPGDVAQRLATLDENEGSVIDYGAGATLVMLCDRTPTLLAHAAPADTLPPGVQMEVPPVRAPAPPAAEGEVAAEDPLAGLPSPAQMRDQIFNTKINAAAEAYLAELRADALIRTP
ncbi:peptidylprolyl isomerase [Paracoccus sp. Z118]|uniref:peptidylprolyl isomerase n=1 Tax=Paracoccus sp. Z118 TaxID=2851017 RepID=UPI001C2BA4F0|nr:peptidylprolyl isomerase [Paracoccus sp. Z118]MBV0890562.1 peptidylprolyl isomerase [Paracoccus sp. Z118]